MSEYSFSDYGIFNDAISTTNNVNSSIIDYGEDIVKCKNELNDESVFMGPICDECLTVFETINTAVTETVENFKKINTYVDSVAKAYKNGDKDAASIVLDLKGFSSSTGDYVYSGSKYELMGDNLDFVNSIKDGAVDAYNKYGVLPSLTIAQAILESGWGKSSIGNNIFGIKAGSGWTGKTINCVTGEQNEDGSRYTINADFRDYDSVSDSIVDHAELLSTDRYQAVIDANDYKEACVAVKNCGYATSLDYSDNLISIIEDYGLDQWDPKTN